MANISDSTPKPMRRQVEEYITSLQNQIVAAFEAFDPPSPLFKRDSWVRAQGGSGKSCVFGVPAGDDDDDDATSSSSPTSAMQKRSQSVLEKAGVNISIVHGTLPPPAIKQMRADHSSMPFPDDTPGGLPFFAAGLSLVVHPRNPHAPTVHANYRYFEITEPVVGPTNSTAKTDNSNSDNPNTTQPRVLAWWFGGGSDLTPSYLYEGDATHFHGILKQACDTHGPALYPAFKKWCDEYFFIPHRHETRGIGGIFFDDLNEAPHVRLPPTTDASGGCLETPEEIFALVKDLGNAFVPSYLPILERTHALPYTPRQRRWQLIRRGRYVEFNLVYDRGTKFGLATPGARIESILMSLPEVARWEYGCELGEDERTEEGKLVVVLKAPREWV